MDDESKQKALTQIRLEMLEMAAEHPLRFLPLPDGKLALATAKTAVYSYLVELAYWTLEESARPAFVEMMWDQYEPVVNELAAALTEDAGFVAELFEVVRKSQ
jgi:hypothetical protein